MTKVDYGVINEGTILKLKAVKEYMDAYSSIMHYSDFPKYCYVDCFSGPGLCIRKKTGKEIKGSPVIALEVPYKFSSYHFIDLNSDSIKKLRLIKEKHSDCNIKILEGDCNIKIKNVLRDIRNNIPFLTLLDPQAGDLHWKTVELIAEKQKSEVLINFPFGMAINRYMPMNPSGAVSPSNISKIDKIFGTNEWKLIYEAKRKDKISSFEAKQKFLDLYIRNLTGLGFKYYAVKDIKNSTNAHMYFLIYATHHRYGLEKMKDSFVKGEKDVGNMFFMQELINKIYKVFCGDKKVTLNIILERMLSGKHLYRVQDFKNALVQLEKNKKIKRVKNRKRARTFQMDEEFTFT